MLLNHTAYVSCVIAIQADFGQRQAKVVARQVASVISTYEAKNWFWSGKLDSLTFTFQLINNLLNLADVMRLKSGRSHAGHGAFFLSIE